MALLPELEKREFEELLADFERPIPESYRELGDTYFEEIACELRRRDPRRAAAQLVLRLPHASPERASAILLALSLYGKRDRRYLAEFSAALNHPNAGVVAAAIDGLRELGKFDETPRVEPLVGSDNPKLRAAALRFLAGARHPSAADYLRAALHDPDAYVRANAVEELADLAGSQASRSISHLRGDPAEIVRLTVEDSLKGLGDVDLDQGSTSR